MADQWETADANNTPQPGQQLRTTPTQPTPATDWETAEQNSTPSQQNTFTGFLKEYAHKLNPVPAIKGLATMAFEPDKFIDAWSSEISNLAAKSGNSARKGEYMDAAVHGLNTVLDLIPGLGAAIDEGATRWSEGDYSGALADAAALGTQFAVGKKVGEVAPKAISKIPKAFTADPTVAAIRSFGLKDPRMVERAPQALSDIKGSNLPVEGNEDFIKVGRSTQAQNRLTWQRWMDRATQSGGTASGDPIVIATRNAISETVDPALKQKVIADSQRIFGGQQSPARLEELLKEKNGELHAFESTDEAAKAAAEQAGARTGRSAAVLQAQVRQIRETLYNLLDPQNSGAGPREVQARFGVVKALTDAAITKRTGIYAEHPVSPVEKAANVGKAAAQTVKLDIEGARSALGGTDQLIKRAVSASPDPTPLPEPAPIPPNQRQLAQGTISPSSTRPGARGVDLPTLPDQSRQTVTTTSPLPGLIENFNSTVAEVGARGNAESLIKDLKSNSYSQLRTKYGEGGNAIVNAQRATAKGIKTEIAKDFPEVASLSPAQSKFLGLDTSLERAFSKVAFMDANDHIAVMRAVLADPEVQSKLATVITDAQKRSPQTFGQPQLGEALKRVKSYIKLLQ